MQNVADVFQVEQLGVLEREQTHIALHVLELEVSLGETSAALANETRLLVVLDGHAYVCGQVVEAQIDGHIVVPRPSQRAEPLDEYGAQEDERVAEQEGPKARRPRVAVNGEQVLDACVLLVGHEVLGHVVALDGATQVTRAVLDGGEADVDLEGHGGRAGSPRLLHLLGPLVEAEARQHAIVHLAHGVRAPAAAGGRAAPQQPLLLARPRHRVVERPLGQYGLVGHEYVSVADGLARREDGQQLGRLQVVDEHEEARQAGVLLVVVEHALVAREAELVLACRVALDEVGVGHEHDRVVVVVDDDEDASILGKDLDQLGRKRRIGRLGLVLDVHLALVDLHHVLVLVELGGAAQHGEVDRRSGPLVGAQAAKGRQVLVDLQVVVGMKAAVVTHGEVEPLLGVERRQAVALGERALVLVGPEFVERLAVGGAKRRGEHCVVVDIVQILALARYVVIVALVVGLIDARRVHEPRDHGALLLLGGGEEHLKAGERQRDHDHDIK